MPVEPLLTATRICKRYGHTQALDDVSVEFAAGEVHALMGENGAGKSTLGKIIAGLHAPDSGSVAIAGHVLKAGSIEEAFAAGVRIVHQELAQCPNLSVAENLGLHALPRRGGLIDRRRMRERAARLVHRLDPGIDVNAPLGSLPPGRRQVVQIASCLDDRGDDRAVAGVASVARVLILDEPTSSLSLVETERLLEMVRELKRAGLTILYVSHRISEIFAVCDRVTVLRDGRFVATNPIARVNEHALLEQMVGRRLSPRALVSAARREAPLQQHGLAQPPALEVSGVSSPGRLSNVSLRVQPGEMVGLAGLVGCGRSELLDAIFGLDRRATGELRVNGGRVALAPGAAIRAGIGYVPEDRRRQGLFFALGAGVNIAMPLIARLAAVRVLRRIERERRLMAERLREFRVKAASPASLPGELSGGNQQKLLLARWMGRRSRVLLLDEPTRGIDVGTKWEIHQQIRSAAEAGAAVLLVSSEMPELLALSDRVLVMSAGRIVGALSGAGLTQTAIMRLATT